jgi:hypothetical protein
LRAVLNNRDNIGTHMKRAVVAVMLLVAGGFAYRRLVSSGPVKTYETFAETMLQRRYDDAAAMTEGLTRGQLEQLGSQERIGAGPAMFQTLFPSRFEITSEREAAGIVTVEAVQTVLFNPAGVESAVRPAMRAELRQVTKLRRNGGAWKVISFENEFVSMDEVRRR